MPRTALRFLIALAGLAIAVNAAFAENRIALVIGNSSYRSVSVLPNPENDAKAMTELLNTAGFEVVSARDLSQAEMRATIGDFAARVAAKGPDTVALVFFAGHGVQIDGENFLVPVDARVERETDVPLQAVRLADLMNALAAVPSSKRIVMLDACRNNPFSEINKTSGRGLAIVDAPTGSIVAYSTSPGAVAEDGPGSNSPFTAAMLAVAVEPGVPIEQAFKRVRLAVHQATEGRQTPWESSSLTGDFFFFPGQGGGAAAGQGGGKAGARSIAEWRQQLTKLKAPDAFEIVIREDVVEAYEAFLALYGEPPFGPRVRALLERRKEMVAWYAAVTINTVASYQTFLASYPNSDLATTARRLMERARNRSLAAGAPPPGGGGAGGGGPQGGSASPQVASLTPTPTGPMCPCTPPPVREKEKKAKEKEKEKKKPEPTRRVKRMPTDDDVFGPGGGPPSSGGAAIPVQIGIGVMGGGGFRRGSSGPTRHPSSSYGDRPSMGRSPHPN
jgi:caspase domain-containing protein